MIHAHSVQRGQDRVRLAEIQPEVANTGGLWLLHVPLVGQVGEQVVLRKQLGNLAPGETRQLAVPLSWPTPDAPLTITADPRHEIRETDTTDNVLRL